MRRQAERLEVERVAGAAQAALHFVGDEEAAGRRARLADRGRKRRRQRPDAAFALHRLGDDRGGRPRHGRGEGGGVVGRDELHRRQERLERRAVVLVGRDRQRSERPAVKRLVERDELGARLALACASSGARTSGTPRRLRSRCCRRTRAAVRTGATSRSASSPCSGWIEQVRRVHERLRLIRDRARRAPGARGRATPRRCPTAGRGTPGRRRRTAGTPWPRTSVTGVPLVGLQHVSRSRAPNVVDCRRHAVTILTQSCRQRAGASCVRRHRRLARAPCRPVHRRSPRRRRRPRARARTRAVWRSCRPSPCPPPTAARRPAASSTGSVAPRSSSTPGVVPAMTSRRAPRRAARWPASVSAFTLNSWPSAPAPMHAMHRHEPALEQRRRAAASATPAPARRPGRDRRVVHRPPDAAAPASTRPTRPSAPVRPTAPTPGRVQRGHQPRVDRARQDRDHDVERGGVGDAKPVDLALLDAGGLQRRVDFLAAAVDDDERRAARRSRAIAATTRREPRRSSSSSPPNFRTSGRITAAPVRSSTPSMTFMFCTAWPGRALQRLSMTDTRIARPDGSTRQPMSQKFVCATCLISGSADPVSRTNVAPA